MILISNMIDSTKAKLKRNNHIKELRSERNQIGDVHFVKLAYGSKSRALAELATLLGSHTEEPRKSRRRRIN